MEKQTVAVLGASPNPARFSNKAVKALLNAGHTVVPVNPAYGEIEGLKTLPDLESLPSAPDTLTVYLTPEKIIAHIPAILALKPGRVIMNPGTESEHLTEALENAKIPYRKDCTLIMLNAGKF